MITATQNLCLCIHVLEHFLKEKCGLNLRFYREQLISCTFAPSYPWERLRHSSTLQVHTPLLKVSATERLFSIPSSNWIRIQHFRAIIRFTSTPNSRIICYFMETACKGSVLMKKRYSETGSIKAYKFSHYHHKLLIDNIYSKNFTTVKENVFILHDE